MTPRPRLVFVVSGLVCVCVCAAVGEVSTMGSCVCVCARLCCFSFLFFLSFFSSVFVATRPGRRFQRRADRFFSCCKIVRFLSRHKHGKCNAYLNFLMTSEFITTVCKVSLHVRSLSCRAVADFLHSFFFFSPTSMNFQSQTSPSCPLLSRVKGHVRSSQLPSLSPVCCQSSLRTVGSFSKC